MKTPETEIVDVLTYLVVGVSMFVIAFFSEILQFVAAVGIVKVMIYAGII